MTMRRKVSWSQVSRECGLQLRLYREYAEKGPKNISPIQGTGVHGGIEHHMVHGDVEAAVAVALAELDNEILKEGGLDRVRLDDRPRLTKPYRDKESGRHYPHGRVYTGDEGNMPDLATAQAITSMMVRGWCEAFPRLRVTPFAYCPRCGAYPEEPGAVRCEACRVVTQSGYVDEASLLPVERKEEFPLDEFGMPGWTFVVKYDIEPDEGGMVDVKVSAKPWDVLRGDGGVLSLDPAGHHWSKRDQALLYMFAQEELFGAAPDWFVFHNLPRTGLVCEVDPPEPWEEDAGPVVRPVGYDTKAIQVVPVEYDRDAALAVMEHIVRPAVLSIEYGIFRANQSGPFPCSRKFCDYYDTACPLGAAARGGRDEASPEEARGAA